MSAESHIPIVTQPTSRRFAARLALFYGTLFGLAGTQLPFFPVWLRAIGIDASWIGVITAVPAVMRFTALPFVTGLAERRQTLRGALIATAVMTALGLALVGSQHRTIPVFLAFAATACVWTPMVPLTDAYALRGVVRHGFNYGPVRLWGSAAFVAGALACGLLIDVIAPRESIWVIVAVAAMCAAASFALCPLDKPAAATASPQRGTMLLRNMNFLAVIAAAALVQSSHAAYYTFASITWQAHGLGGLTIAGLWALGVLAEIVVFALSPRFTLRPSTLVVIGAVAAALRWSITAQEPPLALLAIVQLAHGLSFGLTQVGTMELLMQHVPMRVMAKGQGYFAACTGIVTSSATILSGVIYAAYGQGVYYAMAVMAAAGAVLMWSARHRLAAHPHSAASGG